MDQRVQRHGVLHAPVFGYIALRIGPVSPSMTRYTGFLTPDIYVTARHRD